MLLEKEKLDFSTINEVGMNLTESEINEKYERGEMRIITEQGRYPLQNIKEILSKNMKLDPEYQRRRVWSNVQKSRLIESFIINIPVPPVFLYEIEFSKYEVMDGLQRLSTLYDFYANKFKLVGLEVWPELNNKTYSELPEKIQRGIDRRYISTIVILKETAKTKLEEQIMKKYVFERLNTGGTKLTPQETRNALYDGKMNDLCTKLAKENKVLHELWNIKPFIDENDESFEFEEEIDDEVRNRKIYVRMEDVELVLRFFAYRQIELIPVFQVKDILDLFLKEANANYNDEIILELKQLFEDTLTLTKKLFEDKSFLMYTKRKNGDFQWYPRPSKLVYDPLLAVLSTYVNDEDKRLKLIEKKMELITKTQEMFIQNSEDFNGRNNNKSDVIRRKALFTNLFEEILQEVEE